MGCRAKLLHVPSFSGSEQYAWHIRVTVWAMSPSLPHASRLIWNAHAVRMTWLQLVGAFSAPAALLGFRDGGERPRAFANTSAVPSQGRVPLRNDGAVCGVGNAGHFGARAEMY